MKQEKGSYYSSITLTTHPGFLFMNRTGNTQRMTPVRTAETSAHPSEKSQTQRARRGQASQHQSLALLMPGCESCLRGGRDVYVRLPHSGSGEGAQLPRGVTLTLSSSVGSCVCWGRRVGLGPGSFRSSRPRDRCDSSPPLGICPRTVWRVLLPPRSLHWRDAHHACLPQDPRIYCEWLGQHTERSRVRGEQDPETQTGTRHRARASGRTWGLPSWAIPLVARLV